MIDIPKQLKQPGIKFVLLERQGKKPIQQGWPNISISFDSPDLKRHIEAGGNYGVMGGGEKKLIIVDFDNAEVQAACLKILPKTFSVLTGSGMVHMYYFSDNADSFKIFNENMDTLVDVQGEGKQVVGPGSIHPNGNVYSVLDDEDISFIDYSELKAVLLPFDKKPKKKEEVSEKKPEHKVHVDDLFIDAVRSKVKIEDILKLLGIDTTRNPTQCPFHSSKGGKCLGFNNETAHCFHCDGKWNIFSLLMEAKKLTFKECLEFLAKTFSMEKELEESRKNYIEKLKADDEYAKKQLKLAYIPLVSGEKKKWGEASELLVKYILSKNWIYTTKDDLKSEMWIYKDGIYSPNGKSEIKIIMRDILEEYYSQYIANLVITKIESDTAIDSDKFFKTSYPDEIPVMNGILNIKTRQLEEYNPKKIFFNKMPVIYDPQKKCDKIDQFLKDVLRSEEDRNIFYELCGFGLLNEYKFEKAFMFHGDGRNGKGKTIELLKRLFGVENCASVPLSSLKSDDFSISELFGKRLNLAGDIGNQDLKDTNMFKSLTGRDLIGAKRKFLKDLFFQNYAKFVFACNDLPMVYDLSRGFWDRWILLDFPYTFVTKEEYDKAEIKTNLKIRDDDILDKIATPDELSGLLNKALDALAKLEKEKKFSTTRGSEEVKAIWIRRSNSAIAFCWDNITDDYDGRISKKEFRKKYVEYCRKHKITPKSDFVIKKVLQENFGVGEVRNNMGLDSWEGIIWKNQKISESDFESKFESDFESKFDQNSNTYKPEQYNNIYKP